LIFFSRASLDNLVDVLHDGHMERFTCLDNAILGRRSIVHPRGGHGILDVMG